MLKALTWMSGSFFALSMVAVGARELSGALSVFQMLLGRNVVGLCLLLTIFTLSGRLQVMRTQRIGLHVLRHGFHFGGQYGWFLGLGLLPLAQVFALEFTVPIWTAIIASLFLGERITKYKVVAIVLGLLGVLVILRPGLGIVQPAALVVLLAAVFFAITHSCTKALSSTEKAETIVFYMCLVQLPISLVFTAFTGWVRPHGVQWFWLVAIGVAALWAHFCMAQAMRFAEVTAIVTIDFLRLPLIALVGVVLYSERFDWALLLGGALMLVGNLVNVRSGSKPEEST